MIKFAVKVGLAGSVVYYLNQEGIWKETNESLKAYEKLNTSVQPFVKQAKELVPFNIPEISSNEAINETAQLYWNKGVIGTFEFLSDLPSLVNTWANSGWNTIRENPEIKKLFENASAETKTVTSN